MKYYAGIGARITPEDILKRMTRCATWLEKKGYTLRSGGAKGADTAFEVGCERKEIFRPKDNLPLWTNVFTDQFHPSKGKGMKQFVRNLMNRNAMQILGEDGNTPVDFVVCYTPDGKASGGTGHALKIAEYFSIPVFNFYSEVEIDLLKNFVEE